jgi:murein DD-endopeptidase
MWSRNALPVNAARDRPTLGVSGGVLLAGALVLAGCATAPPRPTGIPNGTVNDQSSTQDPGAIGPSLVTVAQRVLGAPYRFGGATEAGFDCSGLVFFAHRELGIPVARTARAQFETSRAVAREQLSLGDLVFFRLRDSVVDHVGIYAGDNRFIHAPRAGQSVRYDSLDLPYFATRFAGFGRLRP